MPLYSLYYYEKAVRLRPFDPRMWTAMGAQYESLERISESIKCYEKAENHLDPQGIALYKLAKLYKKLNDSPKESFYWQKFLTFRDEQGIEGDDLVEALLNLATYCKQIGKYQDAEKYCTRLLDYEKREKEEAKSILREIHQLKMKGN